MEEQEFKKRCEDALATLHRELTGAADDYGFETNFSSGAITVRFEDPPAKFVISPNAPSRQVRISAFGKTYKLDWDIVENTFVSSDSGQSLKQLMEQFISKQLKEEVNL